jgi:G3E family GTPase
MSATITPPASGRIVAWLVTGFLGSGKTTLLNASLRSEEARGTALLINEFAGLSLDGHFVEQRDDGILLVVNGCVCCTVHDDLVDALLRLEQRRQAGDCPPFDRVIIETTGLADPAPVAHAIESDPRLNAHYDLAAIVALVDATHGLAQLASHLEAGRQVAAADYLLISKPDLCEPAVTALLGAELAAINPAAVQFASRHGRIMCCDGQTHLSLFSLRRGPAAPRSVAVAEMHAHSTDIQSYVIEVPGPVDWEGFSTWLQSLCLACGRDLLRFKGLVFTRDNSAPLAVHAVHFVIYPPDRLGTNAPADGITRLVFIGHRLNQHALRRTLAVALSREP